MLETMPRLGFGTWQIPGQRCVESVMDALELGYRHIDTAQMYENEAQVGQALARSAVPRDEVWITTKVSPQDLYPQGIARSAAQSLERLGLEQVDLLLIHWPVFKHASLDELIRCMDAVRESGQARHIGISNFNARQTARACAAGPVFTNQVEYHPYLSQEAVLAACRAHGITLTAYCPLARGRAVSDPSLAAIGQRHDASAAQVALAWLLHQDQVVAIPKASSALNRRANLKALDITLSETEVAEIAGFARGLRLCDPPGISPQWD